MFEMTEEEIRPIAENYVEEFCHDIHGGYEDGDLVCAGIGTALIVARKLEKQNKELQEEQKEMLQLIQALSQEVNALGGDYNMIEHAENVLIKKGWL